jgi:hypothetical protein
MPDDLTSEMYIELLLFGCAFDAPYMCHLSPDGWVTRTRMLKGNTDKDISVLQSPWAGRLLTGDMQFF